MSVGLSLLYTILKEDNWRMLTQLNSKGFQGEFELPVYTFILDYYVKYKKFPSIKLVSRRFKQFTEAEGVSDFWHQEFVKREFGLTYDEEVTKITPIVAKGDMDKAMSAVTKLGIKLSELQGVESRPRNRQEILVAVCDHIAERREMAGILGIPTGWEILTKILRGFIPKNIYVIAARKKIGKTQSLLYMSEAAYQAGHNVLVISMEMTEDEFSSRLTSMINKVDLNLLLSGKISTQMERFLRDASKKSNSGSYNFKEGFFNISTPEIEHLIMANRPDIVFIDGAYLIKPQTSGPKMAGWERVTEVVKDLKRAAGRHGVPIVATYQFNKKEEVHLSESIAQIATAVMGIYMLPDRINARKIKVLDNRNGPRGETTINFDFERVDFSEIEGNDEMNSDLSLFGEFERGEDE